MTSTFKRLGQSELLPRYIFAESLYARRRVLEIGAVASTLGQSARFLATRGARIVVAADSDLEAVQQAQLKLAGPNLRFRPTVFDDFESGSFDLVIVADLAAYVRAPELLKELARLVAKSGYLMGGLRNPAGLALSTVIEGEGDEPPPTYGQLLDALSAHFNSIEVATQSPVLGYQLAFERGEGLQVDGTLAGSSEAAYYVVLAGQEEVRNFDPTWVQLPPEPLAFTGGKLEDAAQRARDWRDRTERLKDVLTKKTTELTAREGELKETKEQLEAAKDAVSRLTAQLESNRERPELIRDREELATRVRQLEAELTVARERALDAEGRVTVARSELEAVQKVQKDSTVQALAAMEQVRLERARREELATQLEDSRARLAKGYEELRLVQDSASRERIDHERTKIEIERLKETVLSTQSELAQARERELALADARTESLKAIEHLENGFRELREQLAEARRLADEKEADRLSALRSADVVVRARAELETALQREQARAEQLAADLAQSSTEASGLETELLAAKAAHTRALRDVETLANGERTWRETAKQYEQQLSGSAQNVQALSDQVAQLEAALDAEVARARRLEFDLGTAITAQRTAKEQAEAALAGAEGRVKELTDDRDALVTRRDELQAALGDLEKVRAADLRRIEEDSQRLGDLEQRLGQTESALAEARNELGRLSADATSQEKALKGALEEREKDLGQAAERRQALEAELEATKQELDTARSDRDQARAQVEETARQLESVRGDLERVGGQAQNARDEFTRRETELTERLRGLEGEKQELEERFRTLESAARLVSDRAEELEGQVRTLGAELRELEQRSQAERAELSGDLATSRADARSAQAELSVTREELAEARGELDSVRTRLEEATQRYQGLESDDAALKERLQLLEREATSREAELKQAEERGRELERARDASLDRGRELKRRLADLEASVTAQKDTIARLEASLAEARTSVEEHTRGEQAAGTERDALKASLADAESRLAAITSQLEGERLQAARVAEEKSQLTQSLAAAMSEAEHVKAELEEALTAREVELTMRSELEATQAATSAELAAAREEAARSTTSATALGQELAAAKETLEKERVSWTRQKESHQAQLDAGTQAAARALEAKSAEAESRAQALREEHQQALEQQAGAYRQSLEGHRQEADKALAAKNEEQAKAVAAVEAKAAEIEKARQVLQTDLESSRQLSEQQRQANQIQIDLLHRQQAEGKTALERSQASWPAGRRCRWNSTRCARNSPGCAPRWPRPAERLARWPSPAPSWKRSWSGCASGSPRWRASWASSRAWCPRWPACRPACPSWKGS